MHCFKSKYVGYSCFLLVGLSLIHDSSSQNSSEEDVLNLYNAEYVEREEILENIEIQEISNDIQTSTSLILDGRIATIFYNIFLLLKIDYDIDL